MQFQDQICNQNSNDFLISNKPEEKNICAIVRESLHKIIKSENYLSPTISLKALPANHGNFLGDLVEIDIMDKTENGEKVTSIFVKHTVPEEGYLKGQVSVEHCYTNEVFAYTDLHHAFKEIYDEFEVPEEQRFRTVKSYDCNIHVIILENLTPRGYKCLGRLDVMPIDFAEDAIKQMAKFHALSFALEYNRPDYFDKYVKTLKMPVYVEDENGVLYDNWKNFMIKMVNETFEHEIINEVKPKKEYLLKELFEKIPKYYTGKTNSVRCMCHGDFKHDNILFKTMSDGNIQTVAIDYQLINYGSPMGDIFYFLYTGADRTFRRHHMKNLKNIYYNTFAESLQHLDLDVNKIYPRDLFDKDFKDSLEYGLLASLYLLPRNLSEEPEFFRNDMTGKKVPKTNSIFTNRINGVFEEYIERGML